MHFQEKHANKVKINSYYIHIILLTFGIFTNKALGSVVLNPSIEKEVWTSHESKIPHIEKKVTKILQDDPNSAFAHYLLSHLALRQYSKQPANLFFIGQAGALAQQAIELEPTQDWGYIALAEIVDLVDSTEKALQVLQQASLEGIKPSWRLYFMQAKLMSGQGDPSKALGLFEQALFFSETEVDIVVPYIVALLKTSYMDQDLLTQLQSISKKYSHYEIQLAIAEEYRSKGMTSKAIRTIEDAIAKHPNLDILWINLASLFLESKTNIQASTRILERLFKSSTSLSTMDSLWIKSLLAKSYLQSQRYLMAEHHFLEILEYSSNQQFQEHYNFIFESYMEEKAYKPLEVFMNKLSEKFQGTDYHYARLGRLQMDRLNQLEHAVQSFKNAILLNPSSSEHFNNLGLGYYKQNKIQLAQNTFQKAVSVDPDDASAQYNLACTLALTGKNQEAVQYLIRSFELDPSLVASAKIDKDFISIKNLPAFQKAIEESYISENALAH